MSVKLKRTQLAQARQLILAQQGNKCAVCAVDFARMTIKNRKRVPIDVPSLDHCHDTGYVRGVLCRTCNGKFGEGKIKQAANACKREGTMLEWLRAMLAYWEKHSTPQTQFLHPEHMTEDEKRLKRNKQARLRNAKAKANALLNRR